MALLPVISLSLGNKCNTVTLTESTGFYVPITNEGGWGTVNIDTTLINTSVVKIYNYLGITLLDSYSLTGLYPSAEPAEFVILEDTAWNLPDGIYQVRYEITDINIIPTIYRNDTTHELFLCNLCNCKDALVNRLIKACSTENIKDLKLQVDQMEIFIYGIESAFSCGDFVTATSMLTTATNYCQTISDCGCGCGGC